MRPYTDSYRGTGRSTILALEAITAAMKSPGKVITIRDHYPSVEADECLHNMIMDMLIAIGLTGFRSISVTGKPITLVYTRPT